MTPSHFLLALAVVAIWGSNFVVIKLALDHLPPLLFAALRFSLAFFPALLFLPRPKVPLGNLAAYGLFIGVGQFGLLYLAMHGHITPGLASLVVQTQVFFTIGMSMTLTGERVRTVQWLALAMAVAGVGWIVINTDAMTTPLGLVLVMLAALSWAAGNTVSRAAGKVNTVAYVVWSSGFAILPLFGLSVVFEGWTAIRTGIEQAGATTWAAVAWQSVGNTLFGYGASAWWLGETLPAWKLEAAACIIGGLVVNLWASTQRSTGQLNKTDAS